MKLYQILAWFKRNFKEIILSQRKTIAYLIYGLMVSNKASLINIAKGMKTQTSVRHNLKRAARFMANERINVDKTLLTLQNILLNNQKEILLLLDWTTISNRGYQVIKATIIGEGRGIPFYFKTYEEGKIKNNQTKYEKDFIMKMRSIIPKDIKVIIIADRGFGNKPELLKVIEEVGFYYIFRLKGNVKIKNDVYSGNIRDYTTQFDKIYELNNCIWPGATNRGEKYTRSIKMKSKIILLHKSNYKQRWIIATNDELLKNEQIVSLYSKRMRIEQTFKDEKNIDRGYCLERIKLSNALRYDKMLLLISYALLLLMLFGSYMEQQNKHKQLMANTVKYRSISLYQVGRYYFRSYDTSIPFLINNILPRIFYYI